MKKWFAMLLACLVLASLLGCDNADTSIPEGSFLAGFGRVDITPAGVGHAMDSGVNTGVLTSLYVDCVAITGTNGVTGLVITVDSKNIDKDVYSGCREELSKEFGIPVEAILISATHTHSSPELTGIFGTLMKEGIMDSARMAMEDRAVAEMQTAIVKTENMNFVRNYLMNDGTYAGTNFGDESSGFKAHETDADPDLQLIKFVRSGKTMEGKEAKDIVVANFCGHPHRDYNSGEYLSLISANVPYYFRERMEEELGYHVAYFSGASGNVNMNSRIEEENVTPDQKEQGRRLALYAINAEDKYEKTSGGAVYSEERRVTLNWNHERDGMVSIANEAQAIAAREGTSAANKYAKENGLAHYLEAKSIITCAAKPATDERGIAVMSVGDVAFVAAPYEMYDTTGMNIKAASEFKMTFVLYLCNGGFGYMPNKECYDNGGYGVYSCYYVKGTAEQLEGEYIDMLKELKAKY